MRLLDTTRLTLREFSGCDIPPYAILSHRWESEEISFQDLQAGRAPNMKGYFKMRGCSGQAFRDGFQYMWIDSCCIDKTSSSELSEAINSMFKWYKDSQVCYAYLADVTAQSDTTHYQRVSEFRNSKWFTRGWTLQELLAPTRVIFYDQQWMEIGTKISLQEVISGITGINSLFAFRKASIAQKMSWASKRVTTRIEDQAYCLMGLFGVNMPPLYGEGVKAFQRLQLEILRVSDDESVFAWQFDPPVEGGEWSPYFAYAPGLLADSPAAFAMSRDIVRSDFDEERPPFSMTNKGLRIEVLLDPNHHKDIFQVPLNCAQNGKTVSLTVGKSRWAFMPGFYRKWNLGSVDKTDRYTKRTVLFIKQAGPDWIDLQLRRNVPLYFVIRSGSLLRNGFTVFEELNTNPRLYGASEDHDVHTWPLQDCGYCEGRFTVDEMYNGNGVFLNFWTQDSDGFVLLLWADDIAENEEDVLAMSIFIPERQQPLVQLRPILTEEVSRIYGQGRDGMSGADRISRRMKSGKSVSVALRRGVDCGRPTYFLDIEIDADGKLPWPENEEIVMEEDGVSLHGY